MALKMTAPLLRQTMLRATSAFPAAVAGPSRWRAVQSTQTFARSFSTSPAQSKKSNQSAAGKGGKKHKEHANVSGDKEDLPNGSRPDARQVVSNLEPKMQGAVQAAQRFAYEQVERGKGRISPMILDQVKIDMSDQGGGRVPLKTLASVTVQSGDLMVECFDPYMLRRVNAAIVAADLTGITPNKMDDLHLRIPIAKPTTDQREVLSKAVATQIEAARGIVRKLRNEGMNELGGRNIAGSDDVDKLTKKYGTELDDLLKKARDSLAKG